MLYLSPRQPQTDAHWLHTKRDSLSIPIRRLRLPWQGLRVQGPLRPSPKVEANVTSDRASGLLAARARATARLPKSLLCERGTVSLNMASFTASSCNRVAQVRLVALNYITAIAAEASDILFLVAACWLRAAVSSAIHNSSPTPSSPPAAAAIGCSIASCSAGEIYFGERSFAGHQQQQ